MGWNGRASRAALVCTVSAALALQGVVSGAVLAQEAAVRRYEDPQGRFRFDYPASFGTPQPGTNDGFGDRLAAVRFSSLTGLGGEAVLTRGPLVLDVQALGGLYDPIALEVFPDPVRRQVEAARPAVDIRTLCAALGTDDHLAGGTSLPAAVLDAARRVDRMRNVTPRIVRCNVDRDRVVFHKEAFFEAGGTRVRQHIFGAVRFLTGNDATAFHIVRASPVAPSERALADLDALVRSFTHRSLGGGGR
jgi:hypothetical protein